MNAALTFQRVSSESGIRSVTADEALTILKNLRTNLRCHSGTALSAQADADLSAPESRGRPSEKSPQWSNARPATLDAMTRKSPAIVSPYQAVQRIGNGRPGKKVEITRKGKGAGGWSEITVIARGDQQVNQKIKLCRAAFSEIVRIRTL